MTSHRGLEISDELAAERFPGARVLTRMAGPLNIVALLDGRKVRDLIEEANARNNITVAVYRATRGESGIRHKRVEHEQHPVTGQSPSLVLADIGRMLRGKKPVFFNEALARCGGELVGAFPNLRTNVGYDYCAAQLSGTSVAVADTIALSANAVTPGATDGSTTAPWNAAATTDSTTGEFTTYASMARAAGTYAHAVTGPASSTTSYTLSHTWTASNTVTGVRVAGLFGGSAKASQGGTNITNMLFLESTFTATTLANLDQLALTWTVNI